MHGPVNRGRCVRRNRAPDLPVQGHVRPPRSVIDLQARTSDKRPQRLDQRPGRGNRLRPQPGDPGAGKPSESVEVQRKGALTHPARVIDQGVENVRRDIAQEDQGQVEVVVRDTTRRASTQRVGTFGDGASNRCARPGGEEHPARGLHRRSSSPSSARATVCRRTASRSPSKRTVSVSGSSSGPTQAKQTVPTGLSGEPPPGPAMPLTATA